MKIPIEQRLEAILSGPGYALRLKTKADPEPERWGEWLGVPVPGYVEITGPWPVRKVEWIEVNPVVVTQLGRLVPPRVTDYTLPLTQQLTEAGLPFVVTAEGYLRIRVQR
jgi:hypothetical protein